MPPLRRHMVILLGLSAAGCMTPKEFNPKDIPPLVQLQDAPPGKAVIYLLRAPHDTATLPVYFGARRVANLPPATYTVVLVEPGSHVVASSPSGSSAGAPGSELTVSAGERRFLYVSAAATGRTATVAPLLGPGAGVVPLVLPSYGSTGARVWKECAELDAQGFMSISRPVAPVPSAA
jgi:hypothetical protein